MGTLLLALETLLRQVKAGSQADRPEHSCEKQTTCL